jgi:hypothetical protein
MAMMATTTNNSIKVKAKEYCFIGDTSANLQESQVESHKKLSCSRARRTRIWAEIT